MMTIITSNIGGEEITLYEEHDRFFMSECIEDEEPHTIRSLTRETKQSVLIVSESTTTSQLHCNQEK